MGKPSKDRALTAWNALKLDAHRVQLARLVFKQGEQLGWQVIEDDFFDMPDWVTAEDLQLLKADLAVWCGDPESSDDPALLSWSNLFAYFLQALLKSAIDHHPV